MKRIQRKRIKGWKIPPGAIYIGRPSLWGNPFYVVAVITRSQLLWEVRERRARELEGGRLATFLDRGTALNVVIELYRTHVKLKLERNPAFLEPLRGRDICCWCREDQLCHGNVLLEFLAAESGKEGARTS